MNKYIYSFIFGLILFLILNSKNGFSIGVPEYYAKHKDSGILDFEDSGILDFEIEADSKLHAIELFEEFGLEIVDYLITEKTEKHVLMGGAAAGGAAGGAAASIPIDDSVPFVDLNKVVEDNDPNATYLMLWNYNKINRRDIPGTLKYVDGDTEIKLTVVDLIGNGAYGIVYSYAEETPLPDEWIIKTSRSDPENKYYRNTLTNENITIRPRRPGDKFISVAIKVFIKRPRSPHRTGQNDPEIELIRNINTIDDYNCDTVKSRIINLRNFGGINDNVALMEIMDWSLKELSSKTSINTKSKEQKNKIYIQILIQLANILKCLIDINYFYNDLKLANILFKTHDNGEIHIVLGDFGSITRGETNCNKSTYPPPECMYRDTPDVNYVGSVDDIIWGFGIVILSLYGIHWKWISYASNYPNSMSEYPEASQPNITLYYSNLQTVITGLNISDIRLIQLVSEIFKIDRNITMERILKILHLNPCPDNSWSSTGLNPCEPCTTCTDNEVEIQDCTQTQNAECRPGSCNREDFCNNRGTTSGTYPNCTNCNCDSGWIGINCEIIDIDYDEALHHGGRTGMGTHQG